jgi:hypothetical protein
MGSMYGVRGGVVLWNIYCWMKKRRGERYIMVAKKLHDIDTQLEASLKKSLLFSSTKYTMSEGSTYTAM